MITIRNYLLFAIAHLPVRVSRDRQFSRRELASSGILDGVFAVLDWTGLGSEDENSNQYAVGNMNDIFN